MYGSGISCAGIPDSCSYPFIHHAGGLCHRKLVPLAGGCARYERCHQSVFARDLISEDLVTDERVFVGDFLFLGCILLLDMKKLAPEALYSSRLYHLHRARRRDQNIGRGGDLDHDVSDPDYPWNLPVEHFERVDPGGLKARALLIQMSKERQPL